jgi:hypothetical protein
MTIARGRAGSGSVTWKGCMMSFLGIEQKKGDVNCLDGRLTIYAFVNIDPSEMVSSKHPIASMINNGILAAQGNYKEQNNLRDFLKSEMGLSLEEGLSEFLEKLDGLESALDPDKLKEKIDNLDDFQDFIPTPAKIVPFHSEDEIHAQEGDIYCAGAFDNVANANLSVNSFPILYQARYREQQLERVRTEIEQLILQVEKNQAPEVNATSPGVDVEEKLLKEFIPNMLYCRKNMAVFPAAAKQFRHFMRGYQFSDDVEQIVTLISYPEELTAKQYKLLELYARKIAQVLKENFGEVETIRLTIAEVEGNSGQ